MKFSTTVPIARSGKSIGYGSRILLLGSCFASNMAEKFSMYRFRYEVNPFGILFQPTAIAGFINACISGKIYGPDDVFESRGSWHHFQAHSQMDGASADAMCLSLNDAVLLGRENILHATHVFITLGTAWAYRHRETGQLVANCHKLPQVHFSKELLSVDTIGESLDRIIQTLQQVNPSAQIVFTVSPVRHIKDGFVHNQRSKANLIAALHEALDRFAGVGYFPAYEIMMDELRDYRFYAPDMIHPGGVAIDYIWERFADVWIADEARPVMAEVESIVRRLAHRPFNPASADHGAFRASLESDIAVITARFPHMQF